MVVASSSGKSQSIRISGSTRLADAEKERMIKDAERYAEADKKRREDAEKLNSADAIAYQAEKTLADFGVSSYFGIQTFTAGIYKAWLAMDNRWLAAQLATVLLIIVALLLSAERAAQQRRRFAAGRGGRCEGRALGVGAGLSEPLEHVASPCVVDPPEPFVGPRTACHVAPQHASSSAIRC